MTNKKWEFCPCCGLKVPPEKILGGICTICEDELINTQWEKMEKEDVSKRQKVPA